MRSNGGIQGHHSNPPKGRVWASAVGAINGRTMVASIEASKGMQRLKARKQHAAI